MSAHEQNSSVWGVDAWRGVAAFMVVYSHFWAFSDQDWPFLRMMFTGVDLFFVLSGFVFAPYFAGRPLSLMAFAFRRLFRIYPAFVLALALYVALKWQAGHELLYLKEHLTFTFLQSRAMAFYYNPPFWSLPAEVAFYVMLPMMVWALHVGSTGSAWGRRFVALLIAALGLRVFIGYFSDRASENFFFILNHHLPGLLLEFLLGVLTWRWCNGSRAWNWRWWALGLGLVGWFSLAAWFGLVGDAGVDNSFLRGQLSWLAALCFAAMLGGTLAQPQSTTHGSSPSNISWAFAAARCLGVWAGRLSYGVYLFHLAALQLVLPWRDALQHWPLGHQGVALVLTVTMAWLCLHFCEDPLRQWGRKVAMRWESRPA